MMRAFLQRRASSVSAGLRPAARRGVASATKTTTTALRLQQQHPQHQQQQRRRLLLATGATIFTLTAYTTLVERPAKADAALTTGAEGTHASPKSGGGGTNVTIQARLSSSSSSAPKAAAQEVQQAEMNRHGTGEGKKEPPARAGTLHEGEDDDEVDGGGFEEEEEETEEDRKYDNVELEETDCPLCHFMRASACGPTWGRWERCIHYHKEKGEDFVGPCARVTLRLARCIEAHKASFPPVLRNALLGGVDDEIAEDGEMEQAQQAQQQAGGKAAAPETAAALAATTGTAAAGAAAAKE